MASGREGRCGRGGGGDTYERTVGVKKRGRQRKSRRVREIRRREQRREGESSSPYEGQAARAAAKRKGLFHLLDFFFLRQTFFCPLLLLRVTGLSPVRSTLNRLPPISYCDGPRICPARTRRTRTRSVPCPFSQSALCLALTRFSLPLLRPQPSPCLRPPSSRPEGSSSDKLPSPRHARSYARTSRPPSLACVILFFFFFFSRRSKVRAGGGEGQRLARQLTCLISRSTSHL